MAELFPNNSMDNFCIEDFFRNPVWDAQDEEIVDEEKLSETTNTQGDTQYEKFHKKLSREIKDSSTLLRSTLIKQTKLSIGSVNEVMNNVRDLTLNMNIQLVNKLKPAVSMLKIELKPKPKSPKPIKCQICDSFDCDNPIGPVKKKQ